MRLIKKIGFVFPIGIILFLSFVFFYPFFLQGKLPIPSDALVGLYHPFRDLYANEYPNGVPYKNFLLTDPIRQQFPWKEFAIESLRNGSFPIWNPYEMSGKPQFANLQTGVFYPLNILLFISPFSTSWSLFIFLQTVMGGVFMYLYLKNSKINLFASIFGAICFAFSGFMIAWLEWGVVGHTYVWLPFVLLSIDKMVYAKKRKSEILWSISLFFSLLFSFFSGYLQMFFYIFVISITYAFLKILSYKNNFKKILFFIVSFFAVIIFSAIQWVPALQFINLSNRASDQDWMIPGWFIPWENISMYFAPDFFGNPATLNYFGTWNYSEFIGYIGLTGIIFAIYAIFFRRDKKTLFFGLLFFIAILFSTKNIISQIPYQLNIPFFSTSQPTRLIGIVSFSLAILASFGLDFFMTSKKKIWIAIGVVGIFFAVLFIASRTSYLYSDPQDMIVSQRNLILPLVLLIANVFLFTIALTIKNKNFFTFFIIAFIFLNIFDLFRFGWKYTPFTEGKYLYPKTQTIKFLQENSTSHRIAVLDDRILPPNFQTVYKIPSISGYDPLYLRNYAQLIASNERDDHSIDPPFGYNRIIVPKNYSSQIFDLLHVKYILSLDELNSEKLNFVFQEGQTKVYENKSVMPLAFFVREVISGDDKGWIAKQMYERDLSQIAFVESFQSLQKKYGLGTVKILENSNQKLVLQTRNVDEGFLVVSNIFYPQTSVTIDGNNSLLYEVDLALIGIVVAPGEHIVEIKRELF